MNINWNDLCDGKTAIHTPAFDDARRLIDMVKSAYPDVLLINETLLLDYWRRYEDKCCYRFMPVYSDGHLAYINCAYCKKEWYETRAPRYRVVEFDSIFNPDFGHIESGYLSAADAFAALF